MTPKYRTILCDPPWAYRQSLGRGKKAGHTTRGGLPYSPMTIEQLQSLPVGDLADQDCMLWLWATNSHLHEAFHLISAWGFEYKTCLTWGKRRIGLGYWLRGQSEHLLLGVKGNPRAGMTGPNGATGKSWSTFIETDDPEGSYIIAENGKHSAKPQVFVDLIEDVSEPPRIELFSRGARLGWEAWGSEWYQNSALEGLNGG